MCRLFGVHAAAKTSVYQELIAAKNALKVQGREHRDGWGIAYFEDGLPHLLKSIANAQDDRAFLRVSEALRAHTVVAHARRATEGEISLLNCHPFQYGRWVMAHNGNLPEFQSLRPELVQDLPSVLLDQVFGTTDSEIYFAMIIYELDRAGLLSEQAPALSKCTLAFRRCVEKIEGIYRRAKIGGDLSLNVILSNGSCMFGFRYYRELNVSTVSMEHGKASHFFLSSEPISSKTAWRRLDHGQIVGIDHDYRVFADL